MYNIHTYFESVVYMGFKIEREEFINKTFRLNEKLVEQCEQVCADRKISFNRFVVLALQYALEHLDKE